MRAEREVDIRHVAEGEAEVECPQDRPSGRKRLLSRFSDRGEHVWCRTCRREHLVLWGELFAAARRLGVRLPGDR